MKELTGFLGVLGFALLLASPVYSQTSSEYPPAPWPPELGGAFERYYAGDFLAVQRMCQQIGAGARDARLRREAAALGALATMRLPGRDNQRDGKTRLLQLASEDERLLLRPDCQFALGFGEMGSYATAAALHQLDEAAKTFAARGRSARLAEAYAALAEVWSLHSEWEFAVPGFDLRRPDNAAQANELRAEQIRALRARTAELPNAQGAVDRIDLILARQLLRTDDSAAEGEDLLTQLAERSPLTAATAQAAIALAERRGDEGRWADAIALYERVQASAEDELSVQAEARLHDIRSPRLQLEAPAQVLPGTVVPIRVSARNLARVEFEVRRVDLASWLEQRQGKYVEAALPITGATLAARELKLDAANPYEWWESDRQPEPLSFEAPAGALVVCARASDTSGRTLTAKRLVIASRLQAHAFLGPRHIAIWATRAPAATTPSVPAAPLETQFWIYGAYVPQRWTIPGDAAVFPLPAETKVLRDRRWIVVLRAGEEIAICQGLLSELAKSGATTAVLLGGGPAEARVGEEIHVVGRLVGLNPEAPAEQPVELELMDSSDRSVYSTRLNLSAEAAFSTHIPVDASWANQTLRAAVRYAGRTPTSIYAPLYIRVLPLDEPPFAVRYEIEGWQKPPRTEIPGLLTAAYPWGTPLSDTHVNLTFQPVVLPITPLKKPAFHALCRVGHLDSDFAGRIFLRDDFASYTLPDGPRALGFWADCRGWDGRTSPASAEVILADEPVHLWIETEDAPLQANRPAYFQMHWFDPTGLTAGQTPRLSVRRGDGPWKELALTPYLLCMRNTAWRPAGPGTYEIKAELATSDGRLFTVSTFEEIAAGTEHAPPLAGLIRFQARRAIRGRQTGIDVHLEGETGPLLLLPYESGDPAGAFPVEGVHGNADVFIPLADEPPGGSELLILEQTLSSPRILGECEIQSAAEQTLSIAYPADTHPAALGDTLRPEISCRRGAEPLADGVLIARLIDVSRSGGVQWIPGEGRTDIYRLPDGLRRFASSGQSAPDADQTSIPETLELPARQLDAWFAGQTCWIAAYPISAGRVEPFLTLPTKPGYYRLVLGLYTATGEFAERSVDFDLRRGVFLEAALPERMFAGDRMDVALRVVNATSEVHEPRLSHTGEPGLHHEAWRILPTTPGRPARNWDQTHPLRLEPGETILLGARVEATRPGSTTAVYTLTEADGEWNASASCEIREAAETPDAARPALKLERKLYRLRKESPALEADEAAAAGQPLDQDLQWLREEIRSDERLHPGELILVQDSFTPDTPLENVHWEQDLPANCHTHNAEWEDSRRIGDRAETRLQSLTYAAAKLDEGARQLQEYVIVPVRPGACRFPAPRIVAGETPIGVSVSTDLDHVVVVEQEY